MATTLVCVEARSNAGPVPVTLLHGSPGLYDGSDDYADDNEDDDCDQLIIMTVIFCCFFSHYRHLYNRYHPVVLLHHHLHLMISVVSGNCDSDN